MTHLSSNDLTEAYYGQRNDATLNHLALCPECQSSFDRLKETLDALNGLPVPERGASYGAEVWARLEPRLPFANRHSMWKWWLVLAPALAAMLLVAFFAGWFVHGRTEPIPARAQQRVLLLALSDHFDDCQITLTGLAHANPAEPLSGSERSRVRDLLSENQLLRESAVRSGDSADAALLDQLEGVLLDVANLPPSHSQQDLDAIQERIGNDGLLFKVRVTRLNTRQRGEKL